MKTFLSRSLPAMAFLLGATLIRPPVETIKVQAHYDERDGKLPVVWNYFGYDEPNLTYATNGRKLLGEVASMSPRPVYVRAHNLLTTGDGAYALKWGSTNAYTEDAAGNPVYNWTIMDRIFDTYHEMGIKPMVEVGFMPEALSIRPEPYRHTFPKGSIYTGWTYPPKDYKKWAELVFQWVKHERGRYGDAEVKSWLWEVWNEPDIAYWRGKPEEYFKLYDISVDAIRRALPGAKVGGPDSTGPSYPSANAFLRNFLDHCAHRPNYLTGRPGSPVDFISFHPKGSPNWMGDHVRMGISRQLASIDQGFKTVASIPEYRNTPIILGENDPEGCAACSANIDPVYSYRNEPLFASYSAEILKCVHDLAAADHVDLLGSLTWSFEFENQPYFEGFRELASNGLDKPVMNAFRMFGMMGEERVKAESSGALVTADEVKLGVRGRPDVNTLATRRGREIDVLVWNYHDEDLSVPDSPIDLAITGLPGGVKLGELQHFRVDDAHSDVYTVWKAMGSPQTPTPAQYKELEAAGQLQMLGSPSWIPIVQGSTEVRFSLPRQGVSLIRVSW